MKKIFSIGLLFCIASFCLGAYYYSINDVAWAMNTGNAGKLAKYFDGRVDITLQQKTNSYSRSQAEMVLKDFFEGNGVKSFKVLHKGSHNGSEFCIGNLQTKNGVYRTTIFMKARTEQQVLQEIRFE
ncbi:hypothetical protein DC498_14505 [Terrimonas sp.]|uniref:DUF4783 domain-containing protein n=1 Tax=Terrimonas sp. TaxID=1914338 RepID=UPI000D51DDDA|nr:DUF4783 domain-containing protein [Terrimonas sp.]PVD51628.1 hypothetical protein DC498_14505 [Terrimonas sp.]